MRRAILTGQALVALFLLAGCGDGTAEETGPAVPRMSSLESVCVPGDPEEEGAEPEPLPEAEQANGRLVNGACTLVCADASTDADPAGVTDGWGFERGRSCLTPESTLALSGATCEIPELLPLPALAPKVPSESVPRPAGNLSTGFFVAGGRLLDPLGNDFVLRGINHPVAWFQGNALGWMAQIKRTNANSVRIVWEARQQSVRLVRSAIERAVELGMVPMVELHDVTGSTDVNGPAAMAQYYVDKMRDVLLEFEPFLLINIANEWGNFQTTDDAWVQAYRQAIVVLRDAGINHTLVIDANNYGQRGATLLSQGPGLLEADPQHNLLFSTHMYEEYGNPQAILDVIRGAQLADLPLIVGEFGFQHGRNAAPVPVPFEVMVREAERVSIGYLPWSWTGNSDDVSYLDMTTNGSADRLTNWGDDIINGPNGICATSKPASIFTPP